MLFIGKSSIITEVAKRLSYSMNQAGKQAWAVKDQLFVMFDYVGILYYYYNNLKEHSGSAKTG